MGSKSKSYNNHSSEAKYNELLKKLEKYKEHNRKLSKDLDEKVRELATRMLEAELFEEIGRISSELAHDLRGPLQTIRNCTYILENDPEDTTILPQLNEAVRYASSILD
jgi:signal transduction histidine kinase